MAKGKRKGSKKCCSVRMTLKKTAKACFNKAGKAVIVSRATSRGGKRGKRGHGGPCVSQPHMVSMGKAGSRCACETKTGARKLLKKSKCGR